MTKFLDNKTILVTGGTGSLGKNFTKFLLGNTQAKKIIIFSRDEFKQFNMRKEMPDDRLRFFIGDVRDRERLERALVGVDIVIHAAALKQVPALEYNPFEAVKTNILGSQNVIEAAINQRVEKVLLISTDKAAQPVNLYGSTKLCAEKLFVNGNYYSSDQTIFSVVRYGNVLGSRGSIVEHLLKAKLEGRAKITDLNMTRFWITLNQTIELVVFALENMAGGEIFVPKIPSMKLVDLFEAIAPGVKMEVIGIRPGEKLHETLLIKEEARTAAELGKYYVIMPQYSEFVDQTKFSKYWQMGKKLSSDFIFASNTNKDWLSQEDIKKLLL